MAHDEVVGSAPALSAGAAAAHLGVAVATLRSWSRRYGLGPSRHQPGQHRRYDGADMARLEAMLTLVGTGVTAADAAEWVQREPVLVVSSAQGPGPAPARVVSSLVKAAYRLDAITLMNGISGQLSTRGVADAWEQVCLPLINQLTRERGEGECIDVEHLVSWTITVALHRVPEHRPRPAARVALLACGASEWHTLGLDALRAALAERGVPVRMLGAATPDAALAAATARSGPAVVVLWSQTPRNARNKTLTHLSATAPDDTVVVAAGPGWRNRQLPAGVLGAQTLQEAILLVVGATIREPNPRLTPSTWGAASVQVADGDAQPRS